MSRLVRGRENRMLLPSHSPSKHGVDGSNLLGFSSAARN